MKKSSKFFKFSHYFVFIIGFLFLIYAVWQIPAVQNKALQIKVIKRYYTAWEFYKLSLSYPAGSAERNKFGTIARAYFLGQKNFSLGTSSAPPFMGQ